MPLIEDVAQPAERETYRQQLMRLLRLDEREMEGARLLLKGRNATPGKREIRRAPPLGSVGPTALESDLGPAALGEAVTPKEVSKLEAFCLGALLREPSLLYKADRELQALGLPKLDTDDFLDVEHQLIFSALTTAMTQMEVDAVDHVRARVDPALGPRLKRLLDEAGAPVSADRTAVALLNAVLRLRRRTVGNWLRELRYLAEDAREAGDERAEAYQTEISRQAVALAGVDQALARRTKKRAGPGWKSV